MNQRLTAIAQASTVVLLGCFAGVLAKLALMTPKELLAGYGKPTSMSIGNDTGTVSWHYDLSAMHAGAWLCFELYDGRVISVGY